MFAILCYVVVECYKSIKNTPGNPPSATHGETGPPNVPRHDVCKVVISAIDVGSLEK